MNKLIPFHIPFKSKKEIYYLNSSIKKNSLAGRGFFTKKCEDIFTKDFKKKCLMTTSCTHALEIIAFVLNLTNKDEVILPSYTFVSTASAFAIRGAKIVYADTISQYPCIDPSEIEKKITKKTKAVCIVHYAGISCDIKKISNICKKYKIKLIEDCAHSFDAYGFGKRLGTFGDFSTFSFHETKNITSGEGGALIIKSKKDYNLAKIILEKGTDRSLFEAGKVKKYTWIELGSSYALSDLNCSYLYAQLKKRNYILKKRRFIFNFYQSKLKNKEFARYFYTPDIPFYAKPNGHIYFIIFKNTQQMHSLIEYAEKKGVVFNEHYKCLHKSPFSKKNFKTGELLNSEKFEKKLLRLPIYPDLDLKKLNKIVNIIKTFCELKKV